MWDYNLFGLKWGSKKTTVRNIGKDTKKLNNGHFLGNQTEIKSMREEKRREFHLKKKKEIKKEMGALRSLLAARLWVQKWNLRTRPDQMEFAVLMNQLSLSLSPCLCPDLFNCGPSDVLTKLQCCATRVMVIWAPVDTGCFEIPSPCMWKYEINLKFFILL